MLAKPDNLECTLIEMGVIRREQFVTAGGEPANIKLEMDCINGDKEVFAAIAGRLALKAGNYGADFLVSAPHGADKLTKEISYLLDVPYVIPTKNPGSKEILEPKSMYVTAQLKDCMRGVIIDDVLTAGSTMRRIERLPMFHNRIYAGLVIWDRNPELDRSLRFRTDALIKRHVPLRSE